MDIVSSASLEKCLWILVMEVVVGREIPKHWLTLSIDVISQKQVVGFLALRVEEGVVIIALEAFHHVTRAALPLVDLSVCSHGVDKVRATILDSDGVAMTVEHLSE